MEFKHTKTGKIYAYEGVGKMKMLLHHDNQPSNDFDFSNWVDCIIYSREGHVYCREITDFFEHFEKVELEDNALIRAANDLEPMQDIRPIKISPNTEDDGTTSDEDIIRSRTSCCA